MTDHASKKYFIQAYFSDFRGKLNRLDVLFTNSFVEEALILCIVYIDQLASGKYYDGEEKNKENFCRVLAELGGDPFFSAIHPQQLLTEARKRGGGVENILAQMIQEHPNQFLDRDKVIAFIEASSLSKSDKASTIMNLWRTSVAMICYERIRCQAIHGPGRSSPLSFHNTAYKGEVGSTIDFPMLRAALEAVFCAVESSSLQTNEWFGNPKYR